MSEGLELNERLPGAARLPAESEEASAPAFIVRNLSDEQIADVGAVEEGLSVEEVKHRLEELCAKGDHHVNDLIHLRREMNRAERRRHKAGWIEYGVVCGRCDALVRGVRDAPARGTV